MSRPGMTCMLPVILGPEKTKLLSKLKKRSLFCLFTSNIHETILGHIVRVKCMLTSCYLLVWADPVCRGMYAGCYICLLWINRICGSALSVMWCCVTVNGSCHSTGLDCGRWRECGPWEWWEPFCSISVQNTTPLWEHQFLENRICLINQRKSLKCWFLS